ncbi:MAG: thioredoxin family protein [Candidatus Micrarchaeota archaeon]
MRTTLKYSNTNMHPAHSKKGKIALAVGGAALAAFLLVQGPSTVHAQTNTTQSAAPDVKAKKPSVKQIAKNKAAFAKYKKANDYEALQDMYKKGAYDGVVKKDLLAALGESILKLVTEAGHALLVDVKLDGADKNKLNQDTKELYLNTLIWFMNDLGGHSDDFENFNSIRISAGNRLVSYYAATNDLEQLTRLADKYNYAPPGVRDNAAKEKEKLLEKLVPEITSLASVKDGVVVVWLDGCYGCHKVKPIFRELGADKQFKDFKFYTAEIHKLRKVEPGKTRRVYSELHREYIDVPVYYIELPSGEKWSNENIRLYPTFLFFKDGKLTGKVEGGDCYYNDSTRDADIRKLRGCLKQNLGL